MSPFDTLLAVVVVTLWGMNFIAAKIGAAEFPPLFLLAIRFVMVGVLLAPFVRLPKGRMKGIIALSVLLGAIHFPLMFYGVAKSSASLTSIVLQLQVPFSSILAAVFYNDRLGWRRMAGMAVAFAGVIVVIGRPEFGGDVMTAILCTVGAALAFAFANIQIKRIGAIDGFTLNAWTSILALPQVLVLSLLLEHGQWSAVLTASWQAWAAIVYSAVGSTVIAYGAWYHLVGKYPVNQVVPFVLLIPVVSVFGGVAVLGEALTWQLAAGGAMTVIGVGIIILRRPSTVDERVSNPS
jgi:O-acetylserine/cysteine efflux transporter